ncbi:berberine bridge enzyme-like Cyn d 4 [Triticum urartu]|uniref:berberine bridge enzyme-like Cyn d 4 n=1 Tax=Triticum urartu TaxID=4572 RepID=UPI00204313AC|nr:berberine bridge enzyme-like Cyn d 4 [Triticum urartu]
MAVSTTVLSLVLVVCFCCHVVLPSLASSSEENFLQCLSEKIPGELLFTQSSSGFMSVLTSSVQNARFATNATVRPACIVTASDVAHVQDAVRCGRRHGVRLRVRSGGHDYEGLSYRSVRAEVFAVLDLARLRAVRVRPGEKDEEASAWVDSGATLGELYYAVGMASPTLAFPGGACPTVGVGGFLSGGGIGLMMRKFGTGADNVLDARIVNADGDVLDKAAMGEDLFWAIRGGGGESFGVVVSWKLKLSVVPRTVTVVNTVRAFDETTAAVLAKWETFAVRPFLPDLTIRAVVQGNNTVFQTFFLGSCSRLVGKMDAFFPELGTREGDCREMSWVRAMAFITLSSSDVNVPLEGMLKRTNNLGTYVKNKSDYVRCAVGKAGWERIYREHLSRNGALMMIMEPHGGVVGSVIPDSFTPYPHRNGVLYNIQYVAFWWADGGAAEAANGWINGLYGFMEPLVSSNPREAFVNYRDLDIGQNTVGNDGVTTYESGKVWGEKYFMGNFHRLATVKGQVDPGDYFRNEQSIPPFRAA